MNYGVFQTVVLTHVKLGNNTKNFVQKTHCWLLIVRMSLSEIDTLYYQQQHHILFKNEVKILLSTYNNFLTKVIAYSTQTNPGCSVLTKW